MKIYHIAQEKFDWNNIDWTKIDAQLARELGIIPQTILKMRRKYAPEEYKKSRGHTKFNIWNNVDWSKYDTQLAKDLNVDERTVEKYRKINAPEEYKEIRKERNYYEHLDWSKTNDQLLLENIDLVNAGKISSVGLRKNRKKRAPWTITKGGGILNWSEIGPKLDWTKSNIELAKELGVSRSDVSGYRGIFAKWTQRESDRKYPWSDINWDLNDNFEIVEYLFNYLYDDESEEWKKQNKTVLFNKLKFYVNDKRSKVRREKEYREKLLKNNIETEVVANLKFKIFHIASRFLNT